MVTQLSQEAWILPQPLLYLSGIWYFLPGNRRWLYEPPHAEAIAFQTVALTIELLHVLYRQLQLKRNKWIKCCKDRGSLIPYEYEGRWSCKSYWLWVPKLGLQAEAPNSRFTLQFHSLQFLWFTLGISLLECLYLYFLWYSSLDYLVKATLECILGVVICVLEGGWCQELQLLCWVIQCEFHGRTDNCLLFSRQKIVIIFLINS